MNKEQRDLQLENHYAERLMRERADLKDKINALIHFLQSRHNFKRGGLEHRHFALLRKQLRQMERYYHTLTKRVKLTDKKGLARKKTRPAQK